MKELVASRIPPGDRWALIESESDIVYGSLTDCLNQIYVVHKATQFVIDDPSIETIIMVSKGHYLTNQRWIFNLISNQAI